MRSLHFDMETYKELKELWDWAGFCIWVGNWRKANETFDKIDELKKGHKLANFFAYIFHAWW